MVLKVRRHGILAELRHAGPPAGGDGAAVPEQRAAVERHVLEGQVDPVDDQPLGLDVVGLDPDAIEPAPGELQGEREALEVEVRTLREPERCLSAGGQAGLGVQTQGEVGADRQHDQDDDRHRDARGRAPAPAGTPSHGAGAYTSAQSSAPSRPEQELLPIEAAGVPTEPAGGMDDPVARHHDRDRVRAQRVARRPSPLRASGPAGHHPVRRQLPERDPSRRLQHPPA